MPCVVQRRLKFKVYEPVGNTAYQDARSTASGSFQYTPDTSLPMLRQDKEKKPVYKAALEGTPRVYYDAPRCLRFLP